MLTETPTACAAPAAPPFIADRRASTRYRCEHRSIVRMLAKPSFYSFPGLVRDISTEGMGLVLNRRLEPGTRVVIELRGPEPGASWIVTAQTRHATPVADGLWLAGCRLSRSIDELDMLPLF